MALFGVGGGISHDLLKKINKTKENKTGGHSRTDERAYRPGVGWGGVGWVEG